MLEVKGLSVSYGQHRALEDVHVRVKKGEIVVILGANGAGKSTLLKSISGICEGRVAGSVTLDGTELLGLAPHRIVEEGLALVPEGRGIFGELTVRENLTLGAYSGRARDAETGNLDRIMALFPKLGERQKQVVRTMSGGEQQMVAIGRAMMSNPAFLALDEPSLGLSPLLCKELFQNLARVRELGIGVLLVEQNAKQSLAIADRGYLLENAHIVHEDGAKALMQDPAVQAAYLGASGAAAPHTHEDGPAPSAAPAPAATAPARRASGSRSADAVLGLSVADLVGRAAQRSKPDRTSAPSKPMAAPQAPSRPVLSSGHADRLQETLAEIERAAARARSARTARAQAERPM
ncbi:ATP-binding cassette domain-containing protein, partial [Rhodobacterales bacterium HKCCE3408]|nr:ATP-binding cassette domain-containing protein [Rhodobacterales bacterium HKCCE3408]